MDDKNTQDQPAMSSNDELAKTLSGGLQFDELPAPGDDTSSKSSNDSSVSDDKPADDASKDDAVTTGFADDKPADSTDDTPPSMGSLPKPVDDSADATSDDKPADDASSPSSTGNSDLDKLKSSALDDLRPLVGKLNLSPEEKFDTLLLIIRSTDDQGLLSEAHAAAKEISDDTKRAQALLDVIKEVDYFSKK